MTVLIHVLGSDIPHHNRTVLRFFNDALAATSEHAREFMVVGKDDGLSDSCPALSVQFFPGKKSRTKKLYCSYLFRLYYQKAASNSFVFFLEFAFNLSFVIIKVIITLC